MTEAEWNACNSPDLLLDFVQRNGKLTDRKARLFAVACCRRIWDLLPDEASRDAVVLAEHFADGRADLAALQMIAQQEPSDCPPGRDAAYSACIPPDARCRDCGISMVLRRGVRGYFLGCGRYPRCRGVRSSLLNTANIAAKTRANSIAVEAKDGERVRAVEQEIQCLLLRDLLPLFHSTAIDASCLAWSGGLIQALAQTAYEEMQVPEGTLDLGRLGVLADALEDAGCTNAELLAHLRAPGPHVRGCWAVDALVAKS
jgi:hypothetical protein